MQHCGVNQSQVPRVIYVNTASESKPTCNGVQVIPCVRVVLNLDILLHNSYSYAFNQYNSYDRTVQTNPDQNSVVLQRHGARSLSQKYVCSNYIILKSLFYNNIILVFPQELAVFEDEGHEPIRQGKGEGARRHKLIMPRRLIQ